MNKNKEEDKRERDSFKNLLKGNIMKLWIESKKISRNRKRSYKII